MNHAKVAILILVLLLAINIYPGFVYNFYSTRPWFDVALHFLGGFFVAMLVFSFYQEDFKKVSPFFKFIALVGMTMGIGLVWEFAEYLANYFFAESLSDFFKKKIYFMGDLDDTVSDLFMDMLGVISFWFLHLLRRTKAQK